MITISTPFRIDANGQLAVTASLQEAAEHQILDVLMTHLRERTMRPTYGAGIRELLFDVTDPGALSYTAERAREALEAYVTESRIESVSIEESSPGLVEAHVTYTLIPYDRTFTLRASLVGVVTEESAF